MATINLVQGDNLPYIDVALTDAASGAVRHRRGTHG